MVNKIIPYSLNSKHINLHGRVIAAIINKYFAMAIEAEYKISSSGQFKLHICGHSKAMDPSEAGVNRIFIRDFGRTCQVKQQPRMTHKRTKK